MASSSKQEGEGVKENKEEEEREGKKQKLDTPSSSVHGSDAGDDLEVGDSDEEDMEEGDETEEMRDITDKLAHANMLIEEAEVGGFEDKESVKKAGLAYVNGIFGKYDESTSFLQKARTLDPNDDRLEEVQRQISDMQSGKGKEKVSIAQLIENNTLLPRFVEVLQEIFERFDKNKDGALSPTELDAFTRVVNGQPINKQTLRYMRENFTWVNNKGLTQEGFFQLYVSQTLGDTNETWEDLGKLGYNKNLEKI